MKKNLTFGNSDTITANLKNTALLFLLLITFSLSAQETKRDSLYLALKDYQQVDTHLVFILRSLSIEYKRVNVDSSIHYAQKAITIALEIDDRNGEGWAYNALGNAYANKGDANRAIEAYQTSIFKLQSIDEIAAVAKVRQNLAGILAQIGKVQEACEELEKLKLLYYYNKDYESLCGVLTNLGDSYSRLEQYLKAYENLKYAYQLSPKEKNPITHGIILTNLAGLFLKTENYDWALLCAEEAFLYFSKSEFPRGEGVAKGIVATAYLLKGELRESIVNYHSAMRYAKDIGDQTGLGKRYLNLGTVYFKLNENDSSYYYLNLAVNNSVEYGLNEDLAMGLGNLSSIYMARDQPDSAIYFGEKAVDMYDEMNLTYTVPNLYIALSEAYEATGNYEKAYEHSRNFILAQDSTYSIETRNAIEELKIKYQAHQKEQVIQNLQIKRQLDKSELNQIKILSVVGGVAILMIVLVLFLLIRSKNEKRKLELESKALRAQINPHFVFNCLNSIKRLYIEEKLDEASDYTADFSRLFRLILENSGKPKIRLSEELNHLDLYCKMERLRIGNDFSYEVNVGDHIFPESCMVPPMIIQPFVENAIWHGILPNKDAGKVVITLKRLNDHKIEICVADNGIGWSNAKKAKHKSRGIELIEKRIRGKVTITETSPGTKISFQIIC
jgi:tetratricopeptide (TPR) repeat protein